jgi:hypothetical protein
MPSYPKVITIEDEAELKVLGTFAWEPVAVKYKAAGRNEVMGMAPLDIMRMIHCMMSKRGATLGKVARQLGRDDSMIGTAYRTYDRLLKQTSPTIRAMFDVQIPPAHHLTLDDARYILRAAPADREQVATEFFLGRQHGNGRLRMATNIDSSEW